MFPALPHMVDLEHFAESKGYEIFFLTGRPISQTPGTVANLTCAGYDVDATNLYLGYDIVANFGDQLSDLKGGFADQTFKIPNPMYFPPRPCIDPGPRSRPGIYTISSSPS